MTIAINTGHIVRHCVWCHFNEGGQAKLEGCIQSKLQGIEALLDKTK
jgi:hypothetical protein